MAERTTTTPSRDDDKTKLPAIIDGKFFSIIKQNGKKISVKCMFCPNNKPLNAQTDATSNLLKHLKVIQNHVFNKIKYLQIQYNIIQYITFLWSVD
jgi:hypothetical protein